MSQIFGRIWKIIKSNLTYKEFDYRHYELPPEEDDALKQEIENEWRKTSSFNRNFERNVNNISLNEAYQILGIDRNSTIDEIKMAYKRKVKEYHPDFVQKLGQEIRDLATKKIQEINFAFELIKKERGF